MVTKETVKFANFMEQAYGFSQAVKVGGTTLRDYVGADGNPGYFRQKLYVYERAGQPCRVCGNEVRQFTQGARSTYWCPTCQR